MKIESIIIVVSGLINLSFMANHNSVWIMGGWVEKVSGDFSFKEEWSYPEGIYMNKFGQLSCDGMCPPETHQMKDDSGRVYTDSLQAFYQVVDTTHLFHSIKSEAWTYEWAGSDFMVFKRQSDNSIIGRTVFNASTHSRLNLKISGDSVTAWIDLHSVAGFGNQVFPMKRGQILIERNLFDQGVVKADFDMVFENNLDSKRKMYWKGLVYGKIEE